MTTLAAIEAAARAVGLTARGGFHVGDGDGVPAMRDARAARTVILLGHVGSSLWPAFSASPELHDGAAHPLDRWTRRVAGSVAEEVGATALFPFEGPPYWPFQRWAQRAEAVHPSPLGLLIHPEHGLWHAYRAALVLGDAIDLPARDGRASPCITCADTPCLGTCPVDAFSGTNYDVGVCATHIASPTGADCLSSSCRARRACPIGASNAYGPALARFHMQAFLSARTVEARHS